MNDRLLPFLALLVSAGIFFGYVGPTWSGEIAVANAAITNDNNALVAANAYTARQSELSSESNAISQTNLTRLSTFLPDSVNNVGIILDLDALASRSGLLLSNADIATNATNNTSTAATGGSPVGSVDLSLSASGTYAALQTFLKGVEMSERLLDVRNLTVNGSDTGVYTYQMTIRLYWLR